MDVIIATKKITEKLITALTDCCFLSSSDTRYFATVALKTMGERVPFLFTLAEKIVGIMKEKQYRTWYAH